MTIKMKDVFNNPAMVTGRDMDTVEMQDRNGGLYAVFYHKQACISSIKAINAYDANQQEIAELKAKLSLADAIINKRVDNEKREINEFKAMVNYLRDGAAGLVYTENNNKRSTRLDVIMSRTKQQCLAIVKADALDSARADIQTAAANAPLDQDDVIDYLEVEACKLREQK